MARCLVDRGEGPWEAATGMAVLAILPVAGVLVLGPGWPAEGVTRMHEGFVLEDLAALVGRAGDRHPWWHRPWTALLGWGDPPLRSLVGLHLGATGAYGLAVGWMAVRMGVPRPLAFVVTLAAVLEPSRRHGATATVSGAWVGPWALALVVPLAALRRRAHPPADPGPSSPAPRPVTLPLVPLATALAVAAVLGVTRPELGAVAVAATAAVALSRMPCVARREEALARRLDRTHVLVATLLAAAALRVAHGLGLGPDTLTALRPVSWGEGVWILSALDPLNPTWLQAPGWWIGLSSPALVALAVVGWTEAARRPLSHGLLVGLPWLWATYVSAAHGWPETTGASAFELGRYHALVGPWVLVLALMGLRTLRHAVSDAPALGGTPGARRAALSALVGAAMLLVPPQPEPAARLAGAWRDAHGDTGSWPLLGPAPHDPTTNLVALLERLETTPGCALLVLGRPWPLRDGSPTRWGALGRSDDGSWRVDTVSGDRSGQEALSALVPGAPCAGVYVGPDLSARPRVPPAGARGLVPVEVTARAAHPATHPEHGLVWTADPVDVGWYAIPGVPFTPPPPEPQETVAP